MSLFSKFNLNRTSVLKMSRGWRGKSTARRRLRIDELEDRTVPSTIDWTNRGAIVDRNGDGDFLDPNEDSDGFNECFGTAFVDANGDGVNDGRAADLAREVIDATIRAWERVIVDFNYSDGTNTYKLSVNMNDAGGGFGASANFFETKGGIPSKGWASISRGNDGGDPDGDWTDIDGNGTLDPRGDGLGWFLDPTPDEWSEFGFVNNAFSGATFIDLDLDGNGDLTTAAFGQFDLYTPVLHELGHALGFNSTPQMMALSANTSAPDRPDGIIDVDGNGVVDGNDLDGDGDIDGFDDDGDGIVDRPFANLWAFQGPTVSHLLTAFNSGASPTDFGGPVHSAPPGATANVAGVTYVGADDLMNPVYFRDNRHLIPDTVAWILQDAYGYTIATPQQFGTIYTTLNTSNDQLRIVGGYYNSDDEKHSDDVIHVTVDGGDLVVSVNIGNDIPGTGRFPDKQDLPAFVSRFPLGSVNSIVIESGDGDDQITVNTPPFFGPESLTIRGGDGNDRIELGSYTEYSSLTIDGQGDDDTIVLNQSNVILSGHEAEVIGGFGVDTLEINYTSSLSGTRYFTVEEGEFHETHSNGANQTNLEYSGLDNLVFTGGASHDAITVDSTAFDLTIVGGAGADTFTIGGGLYNARIGGAVTISGSEVPPSIDIHSDTLIIDDTEQSIARTHDLYDDSFRMPFAELLRFTNLDQVVLNLSDRGSYVNVNEVAADTQVTINGGDGADTVRVGNGRFGAQIRGEVSVNGGSGGDTLTIVDSSAEAGIVDVYFPPDMQIPYYKQDTYTFTATTFQKVETAGYFAPTYSVTFPLLRFLGMDSVILSASSTTGREFADGFASTIKVQSVAAGTHLDLRTNGGNDEIVVGDLNQNLDLIMGHVEVDGGAGDNSLTLLDQNGIGIATGFPFVLEDTLVSRTIHPFPWVPYARFAGVEYSNVADLTFRASELADELLIASTAPGTELHLYGNGGNDLFQVDASGLHSSITVNGGSQTSDPGDTLVMTGTGTEEGTYRPAAASMDSGSFTVGDNAISFTGLEPVTAREFARVFFVSPLSQDFVHILPTENKLRIAGTSTNPIPQPSGINPFPGPLPPFPWEVLDLVNVAHVVVNLSENDNRAYFNGFNNHLPVPNDVATVYAGAMSVPGLEQLVIVPGAGANQIHDYTLTAPGTSSAQLVVLGGGPGLPAGITTHLIRGTTDQVRVDHPSSVTTTIDAFDSEGNTRARILDFAVSGGVMLLDPQSDVTVNLRNRSATFREGGDGRQRIEGPTINPLGIQHTEDGWLRLRSQGDSTLELNEIVFPNFEWDLLEGTGLDPYGTFRTYAVTNTADSGPGSLRDAITWVNTAEFGATSIVHFDIPQSDPGFVDVDSLRPDGDATADAFVIKPLSALPALTNGITVINGETQKSRTGESNPFGPEIILDGSLAGMGVNGLELRSRANHVHALNIQQFSGNGILVAGNSNTVSGNYIGTDATGKFGRANGADGVLIQNSISTVIGGTSASARNVISGNQNGVHIVGNYIPPPLPPGDFIILQPPPNQVTGNFIGTTADGSNALPNVSIGVWIDNSADNLVGGTETGSRNVISGNGTGVYITGYDYAGNRVIGNFIGTDVTGEVSLPNSDGVYVVSAARGNRIGGPTEAERNIISGNSRFGVGISNTFGTLVQGNYIGTDWTGTTAVYNLAAGIGWLDDFGTVIGGAQSGAGNLISGNGNGIWMYGGLAVTGGRIEGNRIGTTADGLGHIANGNGINIVASGGNMVHDLVVGGTTPGAGNLISGNSINGIRVHGEEALNIRIQGNKIGTDINGVFAISNPTGVLLDNAGGVLVNDNLVSGNTQDGIRMSGTTSAAKSETFYSASADIHGWRGRNNTSNRNFFGSNQYSPGLSSDGWVAGGVFARASTAFGESTLPIAYYADPHLGGTLTLDDPMHASGELIIKKMNDWNSNVLVGSFDRNDADSNTRRNFLGLGISEPSPHQGANGIRAEAYLGLADGTELLGSWVNAPEALAPDTLYSWRYDYDPRGGHLGAGELVIEIFANGASLGTSRIELTPAQRSVGGRFDAFGLHSGGFGARGNNPNTVELYIDNVTYTRVVGNTIQGNYIGTDRDGQGPIPGMVSWYKAEGNANDTTDNNHGTLVNGASFATGLAGQAFSFDGVDDMVSTPLVVDYTQGVTFELWVKTTDLTHSTLMAGGGGATASRGMGLFIEPGGLLLLMGSKSVPGAANFHVWGPNIADGMYHHVAATWTGDTTLDGVKLYLDGVLIGTATATVAVETDGTPLHLGDHPAYYLPLSGIIDEPAVFSRVLSAAEIQFVYARNAVGKSADLGNGRSGIYVDNSVGNRIGGADPIARNVIAGNVTGVSIIGPLASGNKVTGNFIGLASDGLSDLGNTHGVVVQGDVGLALGAPGNIIGGIVEGERNVISGNDLNDIFLARTLGTTVQGNYIGTDSTGTRLVATDPRNVVGVRLEDDKDSQIGGSTPGAGNVISGQAYGIHFDGRWVTGGTERTRIQGNLIGTKANGLQALDGFSHYWGLWISGHVDSDGVTHEIRDVVVGGMQLGAGNVISGNVNGGIGIRGPGAQGIAIQGNYIGTVITGMTALGNSGYGVYVSGGARNNVIGGGQPGAGNVIAASGSAGIYLEDLETTDNAVLGNLIGTDKNGTASLGNVDGVAISNASGNRIGGPNSGERNIISGNSRYGVHLSSLAGNTIQGNFIGTDLTGSTTQGVANAHNIYLNGDVNSLIGGTGLGEGNVISGGGYGIWLGGTASNRHTTGTRIQGNRIGTNASGTQALGNTWGIYLEGQSPHAVHDATIGGDDPNAGNTISGNLFEGLIARGDGVRNLRVMGNRIGTSSAGNTVLGNGGAGILLANGVAGALIGTDGNGVNDAREGNIIAHNSLAGVAVVDSSSTANSIRGNSIHSNGGLGVDLANDGVTLNDETSKDADIGPNMLQNFPRLTIVRTGSQTRVTGTLKSKPSTTFTVDFYASASRDITLNGEGERWLGFAVVTSDANGTAPINNAVLNAATVDGEFITATATDPSGNTSEFSLAYDTSPRRRGGVENSAIQAAAASDSSAAAKVTALQAKQTLAEAIRRWKLTGVDARSLQGIQVRVTDLPGRMLSRVVGKTIWLDRNAAGWGWFIDRTLGDDSEFAQSGDQGEHGRMDLLTVLSHEVGHVLGFRHDEFEVMVGTLTAGTRRNPIFGMVVNRSL